MVSLMMSAKCSIVVLVLHMYCVEGSVIHLFTKFKNLTIISEGALSVK